MNFLILIALLFLTSCGYQFGTGSHISTYRTISIPYVQDDWDGSLTAAIVKQMAQSSNLIYRETGGSLTLKVRILDYYDENIGFRYDRKKNGELRHIIIPDETRTTIDVEVILMEAATGRSLAGPTRISASVEYDHDYYSNRDAINIFSLGQLTDIDEAYDAAQKPLNQRLAEKIVAYVTDDW